MIYCLLLLLISACSCYEQQLSNKPFPDDFLFGVATSSYQVEGGWNEDGKGESIWDKYAHDNPNVIVDKSNGNIACDTYHKWEEDVEILKELGVDHYRFSLSWPRILPNGRRDKVNEPGINYYKNLIKSLKANNIEPVITMYHWDLPQAIQDDGGIVSDHFPDLFGDYARLCYEQFGDDVKYWMTFNEPVAICDLNFTRSTLLAPAIKDDGTWAYTCGHNLLKAHAKAWHIYDEEFRQKQQGLVGMAIVTHWFQPKSDTPEDKEAAETLLQFMFGWTAHPIIKGDYPPIMKSKILKRSLAQGLKKSRLPEFTAEEIDYIKGTCDVLGVNLYTSFLTKPVKEISYEEMNWSADTECTFHSPDDWLQMHAFSFMKVTPWAMGNVTHWIKTNYDNPKIFLLENGYGDKGGLDDDERIHFVQTYLSNLREAMENDKLNVIGYTYWAFLDNFEWTKGYTVKFGLYHVDFDNENRKRTPKKSAKYFKKLIATRCIVDNCENPNLQTDDENTASLFNNLIDEIIFGLNSVYKYFQL